MTLWSRGLAWLRDKLKLLYLHYHIAYENKSWQDGNLPWWASAYKVACGLARSRDKLKPLHLHYHSAYGHQTWQEGKLADGLLPIKPHGPSRGPVRSRDKLKPLYLRYHSFYFMATKLGRMVTYLDCLPQLKSHYPLIIPSCKIMWQPKNITSPLPQCLWLPLITWQIKTITSPLPQYMWPQNFAGWWFTLNLFYP